MRLNRYLAACGLESRRKAEEFIKAGLISVDGKIVKDFIDINPNSNIVFYNKKRLVPQNKLYFAFYKPSGVISSVKDDNLKCIGDFFREFDVRLFPVGRLDYLSEGLILITNDGIFANRIAHPSFKIRKTYLIKTSNQLDENTLNLLSSGARLEDGFFKPIFLNFSENKSWIKLTMDSGKNRIIRRFFGKFKIGIKILKRVTIGSVKLGDLAPGEFRLLEKNEIIQLTQRQQ